MSQWLPISTAPTLKSIWVGTREEHEGYNSGFMEPCYKPTPLGPWKNIYTMLEIEWSPTHWMPLPSPPEVQA